MRACTPLGNVCRASGRRPLSCGSSNRSPGFATGENGMSMRSNSSVSCASVWRRDDLRDDGPDRRAFAHAVLVGACRRDWPKGRCAEMLAEAPPLVVAGETDEDLLAVGGRERLVDAPTRLSRAGIGGGGRPVTACARHVLRHQERGRFEQRRFDELAAAGAVALAQRGLDADHGEHAAHDVDDRRPGAQRLAGRAGHVGEAGHELHDLVERGAMLVRAAEESLERAIDDAGIDARENRRSRSRGGPWCRGRNSPAPRRRSRPAGESARDLRPISDRSRRCACCD